jgi:hypothetical protein
MRVLHGPFNIGNQPWIVSRAERALGLDSEVVTLSASDLGYAADRIIATSRSKSIASRMRTALDRATVTLPFDVLHFYFGASFFAKQSDPDWRFNFFDLKVARARGKRVIMTLQGCDIRMAGEANRNREVTMCREGACALFGDCVARHDRTRTTLARSILPLCDRVFYLNPDLGAYAGRGEFMPYANVDPRTILPGPARPATMRPLILHAPTSPSIKGTPHIEAALHRLAARYDFDYRAVVGIPHAQAMHLYRSADLVIDQVLAGWYGGFAVEAMAMGKPVAAYIREEDLAAVPDAMRRDLPILRVDPRHLDADLAAILERRAEWPALGERSRAYVERWHDPATIARALERIYRDPRAPLVY